MARRVKLADAFTITVSGISGSTASDNKAAAVDGARAVQDQIALFFEAERTAKGPLIPNSDEYTISKIRRGLDPRRGWRTGALGASLYDDDLFVTSATDTSAVAIFDIRLSTVPYAHHYSDQKTRGGLLALTDRMLGIFRRVFEGGLPADELEEPVLPNLQGTVEKLLRQQSRFVLQNVTDGRTPVVSPRFVARSA